MKHPDTTCRRNGVLYGYWKTEYGIIRRECVNGDWINSLFYTNNEILAMKGAYES